MGRLGRIAGTKVKLASLMVAGACFLGMPALAEPTSLIIGPKPPTGDITLPELATKDPKQQEAKMLEFMQLTLSTFGQNLQALQDSLNSLAALNTKENREILKNVSPMLGKSFDTTIAAINIPALNASARAAAEHLNEAAPGYAQAQASLARYAMTQQQWEEMNREKDTNAYLNRKFKEGALDPNVLNMQETLGNFAYNLINANNSLSSFNSYVASITATYQNIIFIGDGKKASDINITPKMRDELTSYEDFTRGQLRDIGKLKVHFSNIGTAFDSFSKVGGFTSVADPKTLADPKNAAPDRLDDVIASVTVLNATLFTTLNGMSLTLGSNALPTPMGEISIDPTVEKNINEEMLKEVQKFFTSEAFDPTKTPPAQNPNPN